MQQTLQTKLYNEFTQSLIFLNKAESKIESWPIQVFGIECDNGWYELIRETLLKIKKLDLQNAIRIIQIKEKFGGLRIYHIVIDKNKLSSNYTMAIHLATDIALRDSFYVCEICGNPGERCEIDRHWLKTLCKEHRTIFNNNELVEFKPISFS